MSDEKLDSFKAGDVQRLGPPRGSGKSDEPAPADEEQFSLGFARIEAILDDDSKETTHANLDALAIQLDKYAEDGSSKAKAAAEKGKLAIARTQALLTYLFETKQAITEGADKGK